MGIGSMVAGAAIDAAAKNAERDKLLKGRTPEQQEVIKYFYGAGGCFASTITDDQYESKVMAKVKATDFKQKALDKIGLDESQVSEVAPVHFEDYVYATGNNTFDDGIQFRRGSDGVWRTSAYQITWLFFSSTQVYLYKYTLSMIDDMKKEETEEYFYKDITNFSTSSDSVEKYSMTMKGCPKKPVWERYNVETNRFQLSAMGDKMYCAMKQNEYTEKAVQGMKAKLREKKG